MSKLVYFMIGVGLIVLAAATIHVGRVDAQQEAAFIQISVLAQGQADYGIDENLMVIPAISLEIIEDKIRDIQGKSSVPVIEYIPLPKDPKKGEPANEQAESLKDIKHDPDKDGKNEDTSQGNGNEQNNGDKDKDKDKDKTDKGKSDQKDKEKEK